ncbi:ketoacyl-ACP synthase III [Cytophagaceae bacterium YF14B1]|uniref:Ketoacyl-ACP synthase III n=1 Tax=Xanthocytophaga flava TaxID=3048013 RepID=A0AAE3U6Q6_9BACT|nr:ketoacyl-ACP synthase III [Xanthocytophaga flavus]MDJ1480827.1 ketoacyl-ACP synthase III [Xanthocytophaga flavus]
MNPVFSSILSATGSHIPTIQIANDYFLDHTFFEKEGISLQSENSRVINKFKEITGIGERRYAQPEQMASDLGFLAAKDALKSSGIDKETLDYIIVAHNFGDITYHSNRSRMVPSLASRIKQQLEIINPDCVAYDIAFGCPGWLQALIQAHYYLQSGEARHCLVIGTETLSRVIDPHDRNSMLFGDGSGAAILSASPYNGSGIISHKTQTYAHEYAQLLQMDHSYNPDYTGQEDVFLKMNGRKLYEFALTHVPRVIETTLHKAGLHLSQIRKVLIHQANEKMDTAIVQRLFQLYGMPQPDHASLEDLMPMTIATLGNSSVATIPTLLDQIYKGHMEGQQFLPGDKVVMASVGAGMNINALVYQF